MKKKISVGTLTRTAALGLALTNQLLSAAGKPLLPIDNAQLEQMISTGFTVGAALAAWWKNNCLDMFYFSPYIREFLSNTTQLFFWKVHTSTVLSFFSNRFHNNYLLLNSLKILPKSLHFRF